MYILEFSDMPIDFALKYLLQIGGYPKFLGRIGVEYDDPILDGGHNVVKLHVYGLSVKQMECTPGPNDNRYGVMIDEFGNVSANLIRASVGDLILIFSGIFTSKSERCYCRVSRVYYFCSFFPLLVEKHSVVDVYFGVVLKVQPILWNELFLVLSYIFLFDNHVQYHEANKVVLDVFVVHFDGKPVDASSFIR